MNIDRVLVAQKLGAFKAETTEPIYSALSKKDWMFITRYDQSVILEVFLTGEDADVGKWVGLNQTLLASTRAARYQGGETPQLRIAPEVPCLDAKEDTAPWYDERCRFVFEPGATSRSCKFTLDDAPSVQVPLFADDPSGQAQPLLTIDVDESFLITLVLEDKQVIVRQWKWGYRYSVNLNNGNVASKRHQEFEVTQVRDGVLPFKAIGPVATASARSTWQQGWNESRNEEKINLAAATRAATRTEALEYAH